MKKKSLRNLLLLLFVISLAAAVVGCNSSSTQNSLGNAGTKQDETTEIKVSDLFNKSEKRLWFYMHSVAYDEDISAIYVVENDNVTTYRFYNGSGTAEWQPTLEDFEGMSDEEIIKFVANKKEPIVNDSLEFKCKRDATGNGVEQEIIKIGTGTLSNNFKIGRMYEPVTILSNQFFGFVNQGGDSYLITKYDFTNETKIILNEIDDVGIVIE